MTNSNKKATGRVRSKTKRGSSSVSRKLDNSATSSPWMFHVDNDTGDAFLSFLVDGKPVVTVTLDSANRIKLAETLIEPFEYNPTPEGVLIRLYQTV